MANSDDLPLTSNHWGTYAVETEDGKVKAFHDFPLDPAPSPIGHGIVDVLDGPTRITAPMVRKSWLEGGPGTATDKRGAEPFVQVSWDQAEKLVTKELIR
ncbi:MAG: Asp-tRNA(Asn)/Glu-tRNA(Gln) amidotransferase GatCAB subunit C, partial [Geminicoccaceae bacterium]